MKQTFLDFGNHRRAAAEDRRAALVHEDPRSISPTRSRASPESQQLARDLQQAQAWQIAQVARHPQRPYTLDYIGGMFSDFRELHGDRTYSTIPRSSAVSHASTASRAW
jgi:acetyl-CoA carboxylase carboxyl transferase subunit alpha